MKNIGKIQYLERLVIARQSLRNALHDLQVSYPIIEKNEHEDNEDFMLAQVIITQTIDTATKKIKEIESTVEKLVRSYSNIKNVRREAFEKEMTPAQIKKYGEKQKLPVNVIYKMLERYYYVDFIKVLRDVLKDNKISNKEIKQIKRAGKEFWK